MTWTELGMVLYERDEAAGRMLNRMKENILNVLNTCGGWMAEDSREYTWRR